MQHLTTQEKINNCLTMIDKLYIFLKIIGSGLVIVIGLYSFIKEEFSITIAKVLITLGFTVIVVIILTLARKYYTMVKLNTKG